MTGFTQLMKDRIHEINANRTTVAPKQGVKLRYDAKTDKVIESKDMGQQRGGACSYPYTSASLGVTPEEIPAARALMRANGIPMDYDEDGNAIITGPGQVKKAASALGLYSGRDGFGHKDEDGNHENTGRRRHEDEEARRKAVAKLREQLNEMPEDMTRGSFINSLEDIHF